MRMRMPRASDFRFGEAMATRRNARRLWGAAGKGLMPPPLKAFGAFGERSMIIPPTRVQSPEHIFIGKDVIIKEHVWLCVVPQAGLPPPRLVIGDGTDTNRFIKIVCTGEVIIGDECGISDLVSISDTSYLHDDPARSILEQGLAEPQRVVIGKGVFLGHRVVVGPGVTIGDNAYIGAGSVVTEDVPARSVAIGNPARVVRRYDDASRTWVAVP